MQWHLLAALKAILRQAGVPATLLVERAWAATHTPDPAGRFLQPAVWTASRLQGRLRAGGPEILFDLCQAKGAPRDDKGIRLRDATGNIIREIGLNESGPRAHGRAIAALLEPVPDMRHTLEDAVGIMEAVEAARSIVRVEPAYAFGELPAFLGRDQFGQEPHAEGEKKMIWPDLLEEWTRRLVAGEIRYDPRQVEARWIGAAEGRPGAFRAILNAGRKDRLERKAA